MDTSLITAAFLIALVVGAVVATTRLVRLDRPAVPPNPSGGDWRDQGLSWRHVGIS